MAMMSKTMDLIEGFVKDGSFKWVLNRKTSFDEEFEEMGRSPSGKRKWISELSPLANVIVGRCSRILDVSMDELQSNFEKEASESIKSPKNYARNFLEYSCFRALGLATHITGHLSDRSFKRMTFDMMLAWEIPSSSNSSSTTQVDADSTVGLEAFCRIAPAIPTIAEVITCSNLFDVLSSSTNGRLSFNIYDKYLTGLDKAIKKMKSQSESSLISGLREGRNEKILEIDGTLTTQPVLEHVGISAWPGRLTLTDHAFYFEALKVVAYDKAKVYELAQDLKQIIKPELTGPWGSRLFDKAVMYKSNNLSEPVYMEFPELMGNSRRDYWLAIITEILLTHQFIQKYSLNPLEKQETLIKSSLCILRLQTLDFLQNPNPNFKPETLLMFNLCDKLPGGDFILEALANNIKSRGQNVNNKNKYDGFYSMSASAILGNLGVYEKNCEKSLLIGEISVGESSNLEKSVKDSRVNYAKVEIAQKSLNEVKVDGLDTNLALMQELLYPVTEIGKMIIKLANWEEPMKSFFFCFISAFIIIRGWGSYTIVSTLLFMALFILLTRLFNKGSLVQPLNVTPPPPMNTMEQLLAVQNAISKIEQLVQDANIVLLKLRALLMAVPSQATDKAILVLVLMAVGLAFLPSRLIFTGAFLEIFTRNSPFRKASTDKWDRRVREWWFSIPAAPVVLERERDDKKKK